MIYDTRVRNYKKDTVLKSKLYLNNFTSRIILIIYNIF